MPLIIYGRAVMKAFVDVLYLMRTFKQIIFKSSNLDHFRLAREIYLLPEPSELQ